MKNLSFRKNILFVSLILFCCIFASCQTEQPLTVSGLSSNGYHWIQNGDTYVVKFGEKSVSMENTTGYWVVISNADLKRVAEEGVYWAPYFTVMQDSAKPGISIPDASTVVTNSWNDWLVGMNITNNDFYNPTEVYVKMYKL